MKNCQDSLTFTIDSPDPIVAILEDIIPPACFGDPTTIVVDTIFGGNGMDFLDYTYEVDNNGLVFPPDQQATVFAGTHFVNFEDPMGCSVEDTVMISEPSEIQVIFEPSQVVVELGDTLTRLNPRIVADNPIDSFTWSPIDYLSDPTIQNPVVVPFDDLEYTLNVVDINGCPGVGTVFVELDANRNVYIPNVFSLTEMA